MSILCSTFGFNSIIQVTVVGINISAAFRNSNVVSQTCLHRVCLLLKVELEYTLSYMQTFYQNAGGEHTSMWPLSLSYRQTNRLPWVYITFRLVLLEDSCIVYSRIVPPYHTVPISPLLHCPPLPHGAALSTPAMSTPATSCWFVHSCKVHPCNMVLNCIVHSRKFSVPPMAGSLTSIAFNLRQFTKKLKYQDGRIPLCQNMFVTLTRKRWNRCCFQTIRDEKCRYQTRFCELKSALKCWYLGSSWIYEEGKGEGLWNIPTLIDPST